MGKKMFATLIVAVVAMFVSYNIYQSQRTVTLSDLALANIEALASDSEIEPGDPCYSDAKYDAEHPKTVQCGSPCTWVHLRLPLWPSISWCRQ